MIALQIAGIERQWDNLDGIEESWVNQLLNSRPGQPVCVAVRINTPSMNVALSTPACGSSGGSRHPNEDERRILELWQRWELGTKNLGRENLIAFLRQLRRLL